MYLCVYGIQKRRHICLCVCDHGALHSSFFQLTMVTSSIFEILRTNMLTRTTAGPSNMANRTNKINQSLSSSQIHREIEMCACVWYEIESPSTTCATLAMSCKMCLMLSYSRRLLLLCNFVPLSFRILLVSLTFRNFHRFHISFLLFLFPSNLFVTSPCSDRTNRHQHPQRAFQGAYQC